MRRALLAALLLAATSPAGAQVAPRPVAPAPGWGARAGRVEPPADAPRFRLPGSRRAASPLGLWEPPAVYGSRETTIGLPRDVLLVDPARFGPPPFRPPALPRVPNSTRQALTRWLEERAREERARGGGRAQPTSPESWGADRLRGPAPSSGDVATWTFVEAPDARGPEPRGPRQQEFLRAVGAPAGLDSPPRLGRDAAPPVGGGPPALSQARSGQARDRALQPLVEGSRSPGRQLGHELGQDRTQVPVVPERLRASPPVREPAVPRRPMFRPPPPGSARTGGCLHELAELEQRRLGYFQGWATCGQCGMRFRVRRLDAAPARPDPAPAPAPAPRVVPSLGQEPSRLDLNHPDALWRHKTTRK